MNDKKSKKNYDEQIIIDEKKNLVFDSEEDVLKYFSKDIEKLETQYAKLRSKSDYTDKESQELEEYLDLLLESPDEVWIDKKSSKKSPLHFYLRKMEHKSETFYYIAVVYVAEEIPTFIYLHFPTKLESVADTYRVGEQVFDKMTNSIELGSVEGDALTEGDELALGLFKAMATLRTDDDIQPEEFHHFSELREETIEEPDEIWRNTDLSGNTLVNFVKDFSMQDEELYYVAVTLEDETSNSHALLFSFPTNDESLLDRYRHGENLQAEEVIQESSH